MKWRQLFWIVFCAVELCGNACGNSTDNPTLTAAASQGTSRAAATGVPAATSSAEPTPQTSAAARLPTASPTSQGPSSEQPSPQPSQAHAQALGTPSDPNHTSQGVPTSESSATQPSTMAETPSSVPALMSSSATILGHPPVETATTPLHTARDSLKPISCHNVKEVSDTGAICLQLNESNTCKHFLEMKGSDLWSAICEESAHRVPSPCQIQLAQSEVDHDCMLLILVGERDPATDMLQESHWEKFGIKSLKRGSVRNHQDFSQKTLIALVTSGLMLAFLGLAGYFLMKRRSWSPAGERLAEDPYYTENGSQGNTMLMIPPQEQPELQEKPNLNGGTQENGTGQASSKNGHSGRQQSPADTEM
ncbi:PREDICTED: hematopoietic progenitor cell antigen CD34 [Nestor notabilis]|uniref:hematopoietic progenitor cell antigen CD34 n=1 Tax=Nestor notabilis TaxID=176057 RepID=UPI0005233738|nr:PREDICTED: hematopoietic progenitor cell antigen CD34 [Nestor notabilis]